MGNAYATPTSQQSTPAPQMAPLDLDLDQEQLGNGEVKSRMMGEAFEVDADPNAKGQAEAATQTALGEVTPVDPDAELADFSPIIRVFERASEQAREQLAQHLQIHTREDWLAAAQADFQSHLQDFETFGFQARAHEARVQRAFGSSRPPIRRRPSRSARTSCRAACAVRKCLASRSTRRPRRTISRRCRTPRRRRA